MFYLILPPTGPSFLSAKIRIEDLNMKAMSNKGFGNGKATMDNGYGMFQNMLSYKLKERGKHLVVIDKWYPSSQVCHCCGHKQPMPLKTGYINVLNVGWSVIET